MSSLLPPNSPELERAIEEVARAATALDVPIRDLWDPERCPLELLPWLAWAWSVDEWSDAWTERQKRDTVKTALAVQRVKGTIGAVRRALGALGLEVRVQEWFNQSPAGDPYTFRVLIETKNTPATRGALVKVVDVINAAKSLRSHLDLIDISTRASSVVTVGCAASIGSEIHVTRFLPPVMAVNEHLVVLSE